MSADVAQTGLEKFAARARRPLGLVLVVLLVIYGWTVARAPIDSVQGVIQKILYVHPPLAYGAYLGFAITAMTSIDFDAYSYLGRSKGLTDAMETAFHITTTVSFAAALHCVCVSTFVVVWGPGLALRGPEGSMVSRL